MSSQGPSPSQMVEAEGVRTSVPESTNTSSSSSWIDTARYVAVVVGKILYPLKCLLRVLGLQGGNGEKQSESSSVSRYHVEHLEGSERERESSSPSASVTITESDPTYTLQEERDRASSTTPLCEDVSDSEDFQECLSLDDYDDFSDNGDFQECLPLDDVDDEDPFTNEIPENVPLPYSHNTDVEKKENAPLSQEEMYRMLATRHSNVVEMLFPEHVRNDWLLACPTDARGHAQPSEHFEECFPKMFCDHPEFVNDILFPPPIRETSGTLCPEKNGENPDPRMRRGTIRFGAAHVKRVTSNRGLSSLPYEKADMNVEMHVDPEIRYSWNEKENLLEFENTPIRIRGRITKTFLKSLVTKDESLSSFKKFSIKVAIESGFALFRNNEATCTLGVRGIRITPDAKLYLDLILLSEGEDMDGVPHIGSRSVAAIKRCAPSKVFLPEIGKDLSGDSGNPFNDFLRESTWSRQDARG
ncbi:MAG: hypothetical protein OXF02_01600 [Simkaniaceae bacterium]|nr:hypothetical protein [Simkaniaceae bacterium]